MTDDEFGRAIPALLQHKRCRLVSYSVEDEFRQLSFVAASTTVLSGFEADLVTPWGSGLLRC